MNASSFELHDEVRLDIDEAAFWYDVEFQAGAAFLDAIDATFDRIVAAPLAFEVRRGDIRLAVVHGASEQTGRGRPARAFSYGVYFSVGNDRDVTVWAVASLVREPWYWLARVGPQR